MNHTNNYVFGFEKLNRPIFISYICKTFKTQKVNSIFFCISSSAKENLNLPTKPTKPVQRKRTKKIKIHGFNYRITSSTDQSHTNKTSDHEKKEEQGKNRMMSKEEALTLYTRMVNSKAKPISVAIERCQIVDVKVHRHRSTVLSADTLSAQHSGVSFCI